MSPGGGLGAEPPAWWTTFSTKIKFQHRKTHFRVAKNTFHWVDRFLRVGDCTSANGGVRAFIQKARPCAPTNQNEGQPSRNFIRDVRKATCWGGVLPWAVPSFSKNSKWRFVTSAYNPLQLTALQVETKSKKRVWRQLLRSRKKRCKIFEIFNLRFELASLCCDCKVDDEYALIEVP